MSPERVGPDREIRGCGHTWLVRKLSPRGLCGEGRAANPVATCSYRLCLRPYGHAGAHRGPRFNAGPPPARTQLLPSGFQP